MVVMLLATAMDSIAEAPAPRFNKGLPVNIEADSLSYDKASDTYVATGSVVILHEGSRLTADRVELDMKSRKAIAEGHVKGTDEGGSLITGEKIAVDIDARTGLLTKGRIFFKDENVHFSSDLIKKTGPESYEAEDSVYTTCDCEEGEAPAWSFTAAKSRVTIGDFFTGRDVFFRIKDVPVLYTPYVSAPVRRERQTGFLMPEAGHSELRGVKFNPSFFWAISESKDATFSLDIETARGFGESVEFRSWWTPASYTGLTLSHFKERDIDRVRDFRDSIDNLSRPMTATSDRWLVDFFHRTDTQSGLTLLADVNVVSDDEYFIDFSGDNFDRTLPSLESRLALSKRWDRLFLMVDADYYDDLLDADDDEALQRLPGATLALTPVNLPGTPLYASLGATFTNYKREEGVDGMRLDVMPGLWLPLRPARLFEFTAHVAPRWTGYSLSDEAMPDETPDRFIYEAGADLYTTFMRDFRPTDSGFLRHSIRPGLSYTYIPDEDQSDLPGFDAVDMVEAKNEFRYSLNSTVTRVARSEGKAKTHQYMYLDVAQAYNLAEERRKLAGPADKRRPLGPIEGRLILRPTQGLRLSGNGEFDVYHSRFDDYNAALDFSDARGDEAAVSYRFNREKEVRYVQGAVRVKATDAVALNYKKRFLLGEKRSLETRYGLEYNHQCWGVELTYTDRPSDALVMATFSLKSLGKVLDLGTGFD